MNYFYLFQRVFLTLWLLSLLACAKPCREWILMDTITKCPSFNSGCLFLGPDSKTTHAEVELCRNQSGLQLYLNLLCPPRISEEAPDQAVVALEIEGEEPFVFYPYILEGMQRLLIPVEVMNYIIQLLLADQIFVLNAGSDRVTVIPDHFSELYEDLLDIPM